MKLNLLALAGAGAILSAVGMLVLSLAANLGLYVEGAAMMANWHMFYSIDALGTITGMIEAAIHSFVGLYIFGWLYNHLVK